ncbi:hypothetical protein TNCV_1996631 [Trichonephila clavipes]|uniref:Uncharacterized protein n=1 Tax=Trichonephila clavipes TaxID=2585209 RepID=A0A8X6UXV2_TRICX|nr:hypothetical protein TNCV_1996631 [Trichonephila clavipes]
MVTSQSLCNHRSDVSVGERSGECTGQSNSRTFSESRKVCAMPANCGRSLSCLNVGIRRTRINGRATGRNTPEM